MALLPRTPRLRAVLAVEVLAVVALVVAVVVRCTAADPTYVALGDSYTAAPGVPDTDTSDGCLRSSRNYPALVAQADGLDLVDVSCSGATTGNLVEPQTTAEGEVAPQLDALDALVADDRAPALVTIGIGANDGDVSTLLLDYCGDQGEQDPDGSPCTTQDAALPRTLEQLVADAGEHVGQALAEIARRAPDAEVLVIGYPQLFPASGTCRDLLPHATGDYPWARGINEMLDRALHEAADAAGVGFVDVWSASEGHDICSSDPWVNGVRDQPGVADAYHPFAAYEAAVADLVRAAR